MMTLFWKATYILNVMAVIVAVCISESAQNYSMSRLASGPNKSRVWFCHEHNRALQHFTQSGDMSAAEKRVNGVDICWLRCLQIELNKYKFKL